MNNFGNIAAEAVRLSNASPDSSAPVESPLESGGTVLICKNVDNETLAVTVVHHEPAGDDDQTESLLRLSDSTLLGDQLVGGCLPDGRLALSAVIPLSSVSEEEVARRTDHLFKTFDELMNTQAAPAESTSFDTGTAATNGAWLRI